MMKRLAPVLIGACLVGVFPAHAQRGTNAIIEEMARRNRAQEEAERRQEEAERRAEEAEERRRLRAQEDAARAQRDAAERAKASRRASAPARPPQQAAAPTRSTPQFVTVPSRSSDGCGGRGGPGYRKANGKCASWRD